MVSTILWHGSPHPNAREIAARPSALEAIWLSGDPEIAAIYAGPSGFVHGFVLNEAAVLLDATGDGLATSYHYPTPDQWNEIRAYFEGALYDLSEFDLFDEFKILHGFRPPLSAEGIPCWEAIFDEAVELTGDGEAILRSSGFHAIARNERPELALGDRSAVIRGSRDPGYAKLVAKLSGVKRERRLAVGVLDAANLRHVATLGSQSIITASLKGASLFPQTIIDDLGLALREPKPTWPERALAMAI